MRSTCVALLVLVVAGCGCKHDGSDAKDSDVVARLDDHRTLSAPVTVGNLTVWPVLTDQPLDLGEFLTLDEALAKGVAEVREVGGQARQVEGTPEQTVNLFEPSERPASREAGEVAQTLERAGQTLEAEEEDPLATHSGSSLILAAAVVNTLVIENKGDLPILVCAGTVVKGGKQDRQIGQDFVLRAKSTTPVDAFCVEQGRWQSDRLGEETGGKFQVLDGMATAKVRAKGQYEKDQGGVWEEVGKAREIVVSATTPEFPEPVDFVNPESPDAVFAFPYLLARQSSSYAVAFDANAAASAEDLKRCADAVTKHFAAHEGAVGFAYAINGKPVAVRTFAHPRLLGKQLDDFVRGMATEALLAKTDEPAKTADAKDVVALVTRISAADETVEATKGLNRNGLRRNEVGYNGTCYVADQEGKLTALTEDWTAK